MYKKIFLFLLFIGIGFWLIVFYFNNQVKTDMSKNGDTYVTTPIPTTTINSLQNPPQQRILANDYHVFQTFNNCGPAALSMALSYYGINESQQKLGQELRPYQNPVGDNDDKSVTLEELAEKSKEYGLIPFHRPNGNTQMIKQFINYDIPIITRTWLYENEDIGHYRVIKGFDDTTSEIIQDDSLQGKNLRYSYQEFNAIWKKFNYEFLVLVPENKVNIAKQILGQNSDEIASWNLAAENASNELEINPNDIYSRFNLSIALSKVGKHQKAVEEFEKVENKLPFRTLWYQIEPIESYYELGNYDKVFAITDNILNNHNRAFSELYLIRGNIYLNEGNQELAEEEFEKAVLYNNTFRDKIPHIN